MTRLHWIAFNSGVGRAANARMKVEIEWLRAVRVKKAEGQDDVAGSEGREEVKVGGR